MAVSLCFLVEYVSDFFSLELRRFSEPRGVSRDRNKKWSSGVVVATTGCEQVYVATYSLNYA